MKNWEVVSILGLMVFAGALRTAYAGPMADPPKDSYSPVVEVTNPKEIRDVLAGFACNEDVFKSKKIQAYQLTGLSLQKIRFQTIVYGTTEFYKERTTLDLYYNNASQSDPSSLRINCDSSAFFPYRMRTLSSGIRAKYFGGQ